MNLSNVLTIVRFTLQEAISRKLILAGIFLSVAFLLLFWWGYSLIFQEAVREFANETPGSEGRASRPSRSGRPSRCWGCTPSVFSPASWRCSFR